MADRPDRRQAILAEEKGESPFREGGRLRACCVFSRDYALGMANLGFQQIFRLLNEDCGVTAERAFLDGRSREAPRSLETGRRLTDFDLLAFSLTHELDLIAVADFLRGAGLLPGSPGRERLVLLAGGAAATANPAPLLAMVDAVFVGEAEGAMNAALGILPPPVGRGPGREGAAGAGVLLAGREAPGTTLGQPVRARRAADFLAGSALVAPSSAFGDTALLEVCRGCPRRCAFCLARCLYGEFRPLSAERVLAFADRWRRHTPRLGLVGAGLADIPDLAGLLRRLREGGSEATVSSLRADRLSEGLLAELAAHGQRTVTLAPESFSGRDLEFLRKGFAPEEAVAALEAVFRAGVERVKVYLMLGLPDQGEADVTAAIDAAEAVAARSVQRPEVTLAFSILLPRPHTPLETLPLAPRGQVRSQVKALRKRARACRALRLNLRLPSYKEAVLADWIARGGEAVGQALMAGKRQSPKAMLAETARALALPAPPWKLVEV